MAMLVSFSRIYNGVHYPSDVVVGAIVGMGEAAAMLLIFDMLWSWAGRTWFPLWWEKMPSLLHLPTPKEAAELDGEAESLLAPLPKTRGLAPAGFQAPHV